MSSRIRRNSSNGALIQVQHRHNESVTASKRSVEHDQALLRKLNAAIPVGRMARPEEIASIVGFLASDGASYMTATTIFADGGIMQSSPGL
jgi:glucose 1-dehydrogenase